jgi:hypothetical protein
VAVAVVALAVSAAPSVSAADRSSAPKSVASNDARVAAAVSPSMSPAAQSVRYSAQGVRAFACPEGYLCVDVWDPTRSTYKVFFIYTCQTRRLSYFYSTNSPEFKNNQTTGTVTRFLGLTGNEISRSVAKHGTRPITWDPVWYIDVC